MKNSENFSLINEILEIPKIVRNINISDILKLSKYVEKKVLLTGEGSSRIFPAKNTIYNSYKYGYTQQIFTEGATQSLEYSLLDTTVFVSSNSGKTKEGVNLIKSLKITGHNNILGVVSKAGTPIINDSNDGYVLTCGSENACAATKSVIEQALFYDILFRSINNQKLPDLNILGDKIEEVLDLNIIKDIINLLKNAGTFYWAGRNDGVAEELRLKTNEITRKKSDYLEGTYAVHGIEEVMDSDEVVILIEPFSSELEKFSDVLKKGVGIPVVTISKELNVFPTFKIPSYEGFDSYLQLCAGLSLLVNIGVLNGINIDKPVRARKVGNEYLG